MRAVIYLVLISLFLSIPATAQTNYNVEYITTENGLPSDGIKGLQWDNNTGFLWIATELGLVRYNGNTFLLFNKENVPALKSDKIFPLSKDLNGNILAVISGNIFRVFPNKLIAAKSYSGAEFGTPGLLWTFVAKGPPDNASIHINDYYDRFLPLDSNQCALHSHDTLWMYHSGDTDKRFLTPLRQNISAFVIAKTIFIYDGYDNVSVYDTLTKQFNKISVTSGNTGGQFPSGKKNLYWEPGMEYPVLLSGNNAWILKYGNGILTPYLVCSEVPRNSSIKYAQYWEAGEILFLGTGSKGILVIRKNYLNNVKKNQSGFDEPNAIYSQILLPNGNVLANTGDVLGPSSAPVKNLPVTGAFHNNIFITKDSILWYTRDDSLYHYDYKSNTRGFTSKMPGSLYLGFAAVGDSIYVANSQGLYHINTSSIELVYPFDGKLGDPFDMAELQPGILAIATSKGLYRYNLKTTAFDTLLRPGSPVRVLWKYGAYLFIGTYGDGIYILKDGVTKKIPLDNNSYLRYTHCFILDAKGACWMSTNRGLLKASLEDMLEAYENNTQYIYYQFFGKNEGMDITEMNGGCTPCGIKLQNNDISFPTMDGALWVNPMMPVRFPNGNIFIDQVTVNGKRTDSSNLDDLSFDASTHDISFSVGFSAWCDKENMYLQYSLNPRIPQWQKIDVQHPVIRLSNLPSGKYELSIRQLKGFGQNNYSIKKISFEIQAPWYFRWWGQALVVLVFVSIIIIISVLANRRSLRQQRRLKNQLDKKTKEILTQNEKLEKNDRIKTRLISIISHDIITPLKYLHLTSKYLADRKASLPEKLRDETLEEVVNTSRELELLSTNILNWIKYQNEERRIVKETINLHDLLEQVFTILKSLAHKNNIELVNDIPPHTTVMQFVDPIRIILYNLTVNSINFTRQGSITVSCKQIQDNIQIEVKDTGMGMPKSQINNIISAHVIISAANVNKKSGHGLGYLIIKDLLKMIDGEFYIESKMEVGTSVYIVFPTN